MPYVRRLQNGKIQIEKAKAFCQLLNNNLPPNDKKITKLLNEFDEKIYKNLVQRCNLSILEDLRDLAAIL